MHGTPEQSRTKELYGLQWNRYRIVRPEEDQATFLLKTGLEPDDFRGRLVLDGGCGMGRYARQAVLWGANVVGMDISQAVLSARELTSTDVGRALILRGDLMRIPLPPNTFEIVYSIGVIDHTPDPARAFAHLAELVRPGGLMAIWVYQEQSPLVERIMAIHRAIARKLPVRTVETLSRWSVPIGALKRRLSASRWGIVRKLGLALHAMTIGVSMHPDPEVRACDTLDWYAPRFVSHHTPEEVDRWFHAAGFVEVHDPTIGKSHFHAGQGQGVHRVGRKA